MKELVSKSSVLLPVTGCFLFFTGIAAAYLNDREDSMGNVLQAGVWGAQVSITPTPSQLANHLVISEVQITGGSGNTTHDFIELYNPTATTIDLNGHRLVRRSGASPNDATVKSWTSSTPIPAHGFYLWASSSDSTFPLTIGADTSTTATLGSDTVIALRNGAEDTGAVIDAVSWNDGATLGEGDEFDPDPGANQSMERKAYSTSNSATMEGGSDALNGNGFDANNNATDFIIRTVSQPQNSLSSTETP